jgi:hypothetical protein
MRLQLTIQRHALPPTNILWTVRAQDPTSTSAHASATISQLLEDVNDIIHLESEEWGLEDYVVEVGGYECLHFQPIDSVLKEDDKVTIRALQTSDLRIRKLGGRHQISIDGRHLFDGVAFGRPYLRKIARPAFRIPPRKRRKLDLGHGQYIEDDSVVQALLPGHTDSADPPLENSRSASNLNLRTENPLQIVSRQHFEDADQDSVGEEDDSDFDSDFQSFSEEEGDEEGLELSAELKALLEEDPFEPGEGENRSSDQGLNGEPEENTFDATRQHKKRKRASERASEDSSIASVGDSNSLHMIAHTAQPDKIQSSSTPSSGSGSGPEVDAGLESKEVQPRAMDDSDCISGTPHLGDTSSSGSSSNESLSESDSSDVDSPASGSMSSSTDSDSGSKSASDSESEMEWESQVDSESEPGSEPENVNVTIADAPVNGPTKPGPAVERELSSHARSASVHGAPGKGSSRTHKNNQRQRKRKKLNDLKALGLLAPEAGFQELSTYEQTEFEASGTHTLAQQNGLSDALETRRQELMEQVTSPKSDSMLVSAHSAPSSDVATHALTPQNSALPVPSSAAVDAESHQEIPKRRVTLDLESSRRMVFGSLGLRTPKTPAAEQELREKLAEMGRTSANGWTKCTVPERANSSQASGRDVSKPMEIEAWRDKLILSAVECEGDGQILSTPPFPFVQRWQQSNQNNKQEGHSKNHNHIDKGELAPISTIDNDPQGNSESVDEESILDGVGLNGVIQSQLTQEAHELSKRQDINGLTASGLPQVSDFNVLAALKVEDAVAGAVIAFKQLDMSKETNWQPQISAYRTAKIDAVLEDGTLRLMLAESDRTPMPHFFDDQTGERTFDKFEMPIDEEDEDPDTGFRELLYGDLIEPKLVERRNSDASVVQSIQAIHVFTSESKLYEDISQVRDSAKSTNYSTGQPSAQIEVSTPRQKEISKLIKDAGFHSSLDSGLLEPTPKPTRSSFSRESGSRASPQLSEKHTTRTAISSEENSRASPQMPEKHTSSQSMNLDGAPGEVETGRLDSPRFAGLDSSSFQEDAEFYNSSSNFDQQGLSSSINENSEPGITRSKNDVAYPRLSQLVIDESSTSITNAKPQSTEVHGINPIQQGEIGDDSDAVDHEFESTSEPEDSHISSLKSTIPPSEDVAQNSNPPSPTGSLLTNPIYSSSEEDLPSLSKLTSTARSGRVSPPPLKDLTSKRQKKSESPHLPPRPDETSSTENHTQTQTSSRFQPSQIPEGTQIVDLTFSSDVISPEHSSDENFESTQRSSVRIKESSSQVQARESLSTGWRRGNRRPVRGSLGRFKP